MGRGGAEEADVEWPVVGGAAWDFFPPTFGIRPPPYPFKSHSMEARQLQQAWHVWGHGTLQHILSACPRALGQGMYTWRHDQVLLVITKAVEKATEVANQESGESDKDRHILFVSEGGGTDQKAGRPQKRVKILQGGCNWKVESDLSGRLVFPVAAAITRLRPDLVIWPDAARVLIIGELTVPWEKHMQEANERKKTKYVPLMTECAEKQWQVHCLPIEVGCRGFVGTSLMTFLHSTSLASPTESASLYARLHQMLRWEPQHGSGPSTEMVPDDVIRHQSGVVLGLAP